ncbi:MAG TPA: hypothetical protein PLD20_02125 [Blastocatellia bacterium]|nr:hypothetical protein [Blastocatellia bacterium]HMV83290.1 hypothetical protein [Blastocatellia bacterium]HMX24461.1 hypothetical protein [Blastocatellia bacterium]HMY71872.1 hypothetical protein [Blastocatellia bacterium]HMZ16734.1 hypothetical protein [Blastocatellia bacterium]
MTVSAIFQPAARANWAVDFRRRHLLTVAQIVGVAVGLAGGMMSGISGALLILAGWLNAGQSVRHWLSVAGSTLLLLTIPMLALGAFCLDWLERNPSPRRSNTPREDDEL